MTDIKKIIKGIAGLKPIPPSKALPA